MSYRVEYNGADLEVATLDAALDNAKNAIAADIGPISGWTVEHDETINDWFVQGVRDGSPVGPTAVVTGPEPVAAPEAATGRVYGSPGSHRPQTPDEEWARQVSFTGGSPAEVFALATTWLAGHPDVVAVDAVSWQPSRDGHRLRIYYGR